MIECVGNVNKPCLFVNNIKQKGGVMTQDINLCHVNS